MAHALGMGPEGDASCDAPLDGAAAREAAAPLRKQLPGRPRSAAATLAAAQARAAANEAAAVKAKAAAAASLKSAVRTVEARNPAPWETDE
jgi:hypothetical protein